MTGGAGFLGSHLVDALMDDGNELIVIDNLSTGNIANIKRHVSSQERFSFIEADLKDSHWTSHMKGVDAVFHYAANPDVRSSSVDPRKHFEENLVSTFNLLEAVRRYDIDYIVFASSSTVYGEAREIPTPESYHPLEPISIYGACKLSSENLISTYSRLYGVRSLILRYANVVGRRSTHGIIFDFIRKLKLNPRELEILGDGKQKKSYLHVDDAVSATLHLFRIMRDGYIRNDVYNVGNDDWISVREIARIVTEEMDLGDVKFVFREREPEGRGWPGDVKYMLLSITKLKGTGWSPELSSAEAVRRASKELIQGFR